MSTSKRSAANRQNAARSTGPKTASGKRTVSKNALRHGLTSKNLILSSEDQPEFDRLRSGLLEAYQPATDDERRLVEMHALNAWRMVRVRAQEASFLNRVAKEMTAQDPQLTHDDAISELFIAPAHTTKLRLFLRYQTAIERAYAKSLEELEGMQARREAEERAAEAARCAAEFDSLIYSDDEDYEDDDEDEDTGSDDGADDEAGDDDGFVSKRPTELAA